jgi:hypothetical protein
MESVAISVELFNGIDFPKAVSFFTLAVKPLNNYPGFVLVKRESQYFLFLFRPSCVIRKKPTKSSLRQKNPASFVEGQQDQRKTSRIWLNCSDEFVRTSVSQIDAAGAISSRNSIHYRALKEKKGGKRR